MNAPAQPSEFAVVGRLQPGITVAQAQNAMDLFAERMDREHPAWKGWSRSMVTPLQIQVAGDTRRPVLLLLAAVGLYGVIAYTARQRRGEIGIRISLGAQRRAVFRMILGDALRLAGSGILLGLGAALGTGRLLQGFLYDVRPSAPLTLAAVAIFIAFIALGASFLPARRTAAIDPMEAICRD